METAPWRAFILSIRRWDSSHGSAEKTLNSSSEAGFLFEPLEEATAVFVRSVVVDGNGKKKKNVDRQCTIRNHCFNGS